MTDAVGVITGFYFYLKNGAGWHADSITTGYLFVNVFFFRLFGGLERDVRFVFHEILIIFFGINCYQAFMI